MIDKTLRSLLLLTATLGLSQTDIFGAEPLPPRAFARIGDHRFYHGPGITCAALSPDGRRAASFAYSYQSNSNRLIVLWDVVSGERLRELHVPHTSVYHLAFSPDGKRLAADYHDSDRDWGVAVFDVDSGKLLRRLEEFKSRLLSVRFSADGKQVHVCECRGPVSVWDAATGKQLRLCKPPLEAQPVDDTRSVGGVRGILSPDGKTIVWEMGHLESKDNFNWDVVGLRVYDAIADKPLYSIKIARHYQLGCFNFSSDGKRFAAECGKLFVWETATGKERAALDVPQLIRFALTPDGKRAVILAAGSRLCLWDLERGKTLRDFYPGFVSLQHDLLKTPQVFSADGKSFLLATDSTLRLFDTTTGNECAASGHRAPIAPRFSAAGRTLFTSCAEQRISWDVTSANKPARLRHEARKVWEIGCLAHSGDERLFLERHDPRVHVRESETGRIVCKLEDPDRISASGLFSPDATQVLLHHSADLSGRSGKPDGFRLYDARTGKVLGEMPYGIRSLPVFSPDGRLIARADGNGTIHLHDTACGKMVRTLRSTRSLPYLEWDAAQLLFSPDSKYAIEGWPTMLLRVFEVSRGREVSHFYANPENISRADRLSCMACSPDNRLLAVAQEGLGTIRLLEIASGKARAEFVGHRHGVHGLAFAPDGKTLASGGEDNVVFLWDVTETRMSAANKATDNDLTSLWNDLASEDGKRAGIAIASLSRTPAPSLAFLQERLRPTETPDEKHLAQLLAALDADAYETRETASRELAHLGERAEAALRRALTNRPSLEMRRRIEDVRSKLEPSPLPPETLQQLRAIEVLEHVGTLAARRCLEALATGAPDARPTRDAKAALQRLAKSRG